MSHAPLLADEAEGLIRELVAGQRPSPRPVAIAMAGGVAAGKSTVLRWLFAQRRVPAGAHLHDPDALMQRLPGFVREAAQDPRRAFATWERPARWVAEEALRRALELRADVCLDRGLLLPDSPALVQDLKERRYRLTIYHVACPLEVALARARRREQQTGRHVPEAVIMERHGRIAELLPTYIAAADELFEVVSEEAEPRFVRHWVAGRPA